MILKVMLGFFLSVIVIIGFLIKNAPMCFFGILMLVYFIYRITGNPK